MSGTQIILAIAAVFVIAVVAPIVFFYIRPNYERFQKREPWMNVFLLIFTGIGSLAISAKTERSWRTVFSIVALLDFICGLLLFCVALFMY
jgi:EamA domain-containing membrane protein RarD